MNLYQPNSDLRALDWQALGAAIARGDTHAAGQHLDTIVADYPEAREMVERGRAVVNNRAYSGVVRELASSNRVLAMDTRL